MQGEVQRFLFSLFYTECDPWPVFCLTAFDLLCPSLRWLFRDGLLPDDTYFVGFARSNLTVEDIKTSCLPHMKVVYLRLLVGCLRPDCWLIGCVFRNCCHPQVTDEESESLSAFFSKNSYVRGRYDDDSSFTQLNAHLSSLPKGAEANRLFYLALPPTVYHDVSANIRAHCMGSKSVSVILANPQKRLVYVLFDDIFLISFVCETEAGTG